MTPASPAKYKKTWRLTLFIRTTQHVNTCETLLSCETYYFFVLCSMASCLTPGFRLKSLS